MTEFSPNPHRTALHGADLPDGPLTPRQRRIADAVRGCRSLADFASAPKAVAVAVAVAEVPRGMAPEAAERVMREGIARARADLDRMEALLRAYGPAPFMPREEPAPAAAGATRHEVVVETLRRIALRGHVPTRAGDRRVVARPDGTWDVAE